MSDPPSSPDHDPRYHNFSQPASTQIELQPLPLSITRSGTGSIKDLGRTSSFSKDVSGDGGVAVGGGEQSAGELQDEVQVPQEGKYLEGGYGWLIVFSTFIIAFHFLGMVYSWGVIQSDLLNNHLASSRKLSVIGGLQAFCFAGFCIPASWIITRIGYKYTGILGIVIDGLALILASFSTKSLGGLIFLQGIVLGCTSGLLFMTVYPLPSQYFLRKRGFATGITSCGGGLGGAAWSVIIQKLIERVGLPWTYRIMGLVTLGMCLPATFILRPGYKHPRPTRLDNTPEPSIFKSSKFVRVLIACFIVSYPFFIPPFFIPQYAVSVGRSPSDGALYSALYNIASGVGRLGFGILADVATGNLTAWGLSMLSILLSSLFVWPYATTSGGIIGFAFWCGLGSGGYFSLQSSITAQTAGSHRVAEAIGWIELATCFGYLLGPITAGILLDAFGGPNQGAKPYKPSMYLVGATTTVALLLVISVRLSYTKKLFAKA